MTAPSSPARSGNSGSTALAALAGAVFGFLAATVIVGAVGYVYVKKEAREARRGWNLVPIVVADRFVPEDTAITLDMLVQRQIPEQFVTGSMVESDRARSLEGQKVQVAVQRGDPILWTQFGSTKTSEVLFARRDVPAGSVLTEDDLEEREMKVKLLTPSWVLSIDRPQVLDRKVVAPFRRGDPILWTHFRAEPAPVTPGGANARAE
ncbi:MAG: SAF domain-containing protein [Myxococcaceae bacterium]